jgi:hypothetical protein
MKRRAGPAVDDVQQAPAPRRGAGRPAAPGADAGLLEYHDTAVGRLPRGPAADAALAAAALSSPAEVAAPDAEAARGAGLARLVPVLVAAALAAAIAILAWRRSTA